MTYHTASRPLSRLRPLHGLGTDIDRPGTGANAGAFVTSLTPYNITSVEAQFVPQTLNTAMYAAGFPAGYVQSGWSDAGHIWMTYVSKSGWSDATRRAALTTAVRAAERNISSIAKLLLPGESAPSGASASSAPPGTPTSVPSSTAPSGTVSGGTVGQSVPTSTVQALLISKGYPLSGGADGVFGTNTATALRLSLSKIGRYVVMGGVPTTYTVSADKRSISFSSGTWETLQSAPRYVASGGGPTTPTPADLTIAEDTGDGGGAGVDMGTLWPWLAVGAGVLAVGGYYYYQSKKHPGGGSGRKLMVRNHRRSRRSYAEREFWVRKHKGLYDWWQSSGMSKPDFIREHHQEIDEAMDRVLGGEKWQGPSKKQVRNRRHSRRMHANHSNAEREMWILNDEGLYNWWQSSRMSKRNFIKEHREEIDSAIDRALGGERFERRKGRYGVIG